MYFKCDFSIFSLLFLFLLLFDIYTFYTLYNKKKLKYDFPLIELFLILVSQWTKKNTK